MHHRCTATGTSLMHRSINGSCRPEVSDDANDVYVIALENGKDLLIPAIKECILQVDIENKKMDVHVMEGLRD